MYNILKYTEGRKETFPLSSSYLAYHIYLMLFVLHLERKLLSYDGFNLAHCCFSS